jgi:hypothetical protein
MDLTAWVLYLFLSVAVLAGTVVHYRGREPAGRGRYGLALLRGAALAVLLLLLFDPVLPTWRAARALPTVVLVDASLSMSLPAPDGTTRWEEAGAAVTELEPDVLMVFGSAGATRVATLEETRPDQPGARLAPALASILEAGPARIVVVTDGAVEDPGESGRLAGRSATDLQVRSVGRATAGNLAVAEVDVPRWAESGDSVSVVARIARIGEGVPDSSTVVLRWGDTELARGRVATPPEGRTEAIALRFTTIAAMEGRIRLDVSLEETDAVPADDARSAYLMVAEEPAGLVLVSFRADQEPRFLLPVLERSLGLPVRGWLAIGPDHFVRLGDGPEAGLTAPSAAIRRVVAEADLLVLHGLGPAAPAWAMTAARQAERALLFPTAAVEGVPVEPAASRPGDWYPAPELPPSPAAAFLAGAPMDAAPPLLGVRPAEVPVGWWTPLEARQDRRGEGHPVLAAGHVGDRRVAVALADGYWRWAFDEHGGRPLYEAFWAGVGTWLVADAPVRAGEQVRPEPRVVPRGEPIRWAVPPAADSVRVTLHPVPGPVAAWPDAPAGVTMDTVVAAVGGSAVQTAPVPGHYRFEARAFLGAAESVTGTGELTVEAYSPEFTRPARALELGAGPPGGEPDRAVRAGRALRATAWPYALVIVLVCAEWVLRRRWGLR